jgi:uncharacterized protein (DUF1919 family)
MFISNTCVGAELHKILCPSNEYNNPFIATLIPNDTAYLKLINNLQEYSMQTPSLGPPLEKWYIHPAITLPYPVIFLGDIEIHCIHESDTKATMDKFTRRLERMRNFIELKDSKIYATLSFSELLNDHDDINLIIQQFCQPPGIVNKIFLGPSKYKCNNKHYVSVEQWNTISLIRNSSNVYFFNDQHFTTKMFVEYIRHLVV